MDRLIELYRKYRGRDPQKVTPITAAASNRKYWRLDDLVGTIGTDRKENKAFIALSEHFVDRGLPVPEVLGVSSDGMAYLQTSVGNESLYDVVIRLRDDEGRFSPGAERLLEQGIDMLARFHKDGSPQLDFAGCCIRPAMDQRAVMWDLNYFKYCFLKPSAIEFDEEKLDADFIRLAQLTSALPTDGVMLRDFQSRNIMLGSDGSLAMIDFQGARRGAPHYDLVSYLWQSRLALPEDMRNRLVDRYIRQAGIEDADEFRSKIPLFVMLRTLQTLAVYGFKGLVEHREMFVKSIPTALHNLVGLDEALSRFPVLKDVVLRLSRLPRFVRHTQDEGLTVTVTSFAYKLGIPVDNSGNGGGFVFDCRAIHNPGRFDRYKPLTGRDPEVIEFIEGNPDAGAFLSAAYSMVDSSVERYLQRGFTSLSVCFGCTGGRHRSVYCAESMARHLRERFPSVRVRLIHREQRLTFDFPPR
ncbi:MAG: phosphotransferase [Paramuribaculum sp.]|nr:phosphotransferase [Paramuribaculum sp.]